VRPPQGTRTGLASERAVALFLLAVLAFSPFALSIFNVPNFLFGIPLLLVYLFLAWAVVIALIASTAVVGFAKGDEEESDVAPGPPPRQSAGGA